MTAPIELSTQTEKKLVRIERDYSDGELCQFEPIFPMELDGRVNPQDFSKTIAHLNSLLQKAHKPLNSVFDNMLECLTLYMSSLFYKSHYKRTLASIDEYIAEQNTNIYHPGNVHIVSPRETAYLYIRMELS